MRNEYPANFSEARRVLHSPRRPKTVWLSSRAAKRHTATPPLDITGPTLPGAVLRVEVWSGFLHLRVLSGNVQIVSASGWGNPVTVLPEAAATTTVHVQTGCKAHISGLPAASVSGDLARAHLSPYRPEPEPATPQVTCPF